MVKRISLEEFLGLIKKIPITKGKICLSQPDSKNYDEVITNLDNCNHLYLTSLSYFTARQTNKQLLENTHHISDVRVVLNVTDFGDTPAEDKINKILDYTLKNNPYIMFFYNDKNHSKIISNGKLMYIGSANFTEQSKNNYEAGVLVEDTEAIRKVEYVTFSKIDNYFPIVTDPIYPIIISTLSYYQKLLIKLENIDYIYSTIVEALKLNKTLNELNPEPVLIPIQIADAFESHSNEDVFSSLPTNMPYVGSFITAHILCNSSLYPGKEDLLEIYERNFTKIRSNIINNAYYFHDTNNLLTILSNLESIIEGFKDSHHLGEETDKDFSDIQGDIINNLFDINRNMWLEYLTKRMSIKVKYDHEIVDNFEIIIKRLFELRKLWFNSLLNPTVKRTIYTDYPYDLIGQISSCPDRISELVNDLLIR